MNLAQFMARVTKREDGCWDVRGEVTRLGYVRLWVGRRRILAHRLAYEMMCAPIPADADLDHVCRNRGCCNPEHLNPATHAENCRRRINAKLTAPMAETIRARRAAGESARRLAKEFGVSNVMIYNVVNRKAWA